MASFQNSGRLLSSVLFLSMGPNSFASGVFSIILALPKRALESKNTIDRERSLHQRSRLPNRTAATSGQSHGDGGEDRVVPAHARPALFILLARVNHIRKLWRGSQHRAPEPDGEALHAVRDDVDLITRVGVEGALAELRQGAVGRQELGGACSKAGAFRQQS
eukprot:scaffold35743_cov157-Isochrysis_galbana.AAC.1